MLWLGEAKRPETRAARIEKSVRMLADGVICGSRGDRRLPEGWRQH
jgi:uncharacterized protein YdeI (YjbR/CyaY-like superfamily)